MDPAIEVYEGILLLIAEMACGGDEWLYFDDKVCSSTQYANKSTNA